MRNGWANSISRPSLKLISKLQMLIWAREKSGFDLGAAAKKLRVHPEQLQAWEGGDKQPTINQALSLPEMLDANRATTRVAHTKTLQAFANHLR